MSESKQQVVVTGEASPADDAGCAAVASRQCPILTLPDELLGDIFEISTLPVDKWDIKHHEIYQTALALTLVCWRFNRLAAPILYSSLTISCAAGSTYEYPPQASINHLHRTLRKRPSLWHLCQKLSILQADVSTAPESPSNLHIATDLTTWLTATKSLEISWYDPAFPQVWMLLDLAGEHMTNLRELHLDGGFRNLDLAPVVEALINRHIGALRSLALTGVSTRGSSAAWTKLKESAGTMPFTELKLLGFLQIPEILRDLVRWPVRLEKFSFEYVYGRDYDSDSLYHDWSLGTLAPMLEIHRDTLRSILVTNINRGGLAGFDLSNYKELKYLSLSSRTTGIDTSLVANIMAPNLYELQWDMTLEDQQCQVPLDAFGQAEEDWLRAAVAAAVERKSLLREIHVKFVPVCFVSGGPRGAGLDELVYPWDRMDAVGREAQLKGIKLSYSKPEISKEEWEQSVAGLRSYYADDD